MRLGSSFTDGRALALTLLWVAGLAIAGSTDTLLFLAPALLIAVPLFCGLYVGEELIAKLGARRRERRRRPHALPAKPPALRTWRPSGASLIAFSLAKRPPPLVALAQN
ncbi:MAG TPA: hypothetical protein VG898_05820 [Solirubrobacterales bacterium]|nr:hypothetical protein [Solirubrobacterales bacterium]